MAHVVEIGRESRESRQSVRNGSTSRGSQPGDRTTPGSSEGEKKKRIAKLQTNLACSGMVVEKRRKIDTGSINDSKRTQLLHDVLRSRHTDRAMSHKELPEHKRGSKEHALYERFIWRKGLHEPPTEKEEEKPKEASKSDYQLLRRTRADDEDVIMRIARELNMEDDALGRANKRCTTLRNKLHVANENLGGLTAVRPWSRNTLIDVVSNTENACAEVLVRLEQRAIGKFVIENMHYGELDALRRSIKQSRSHADLCTQFSAPRTTNRLHEDQHQLSLHPAMAKLDDTVLEAPDSLSRLLQEFPWKAGVQAS